MNPFLSILQARSEFKSIALSNGNHKYSYTDIFSESRKLATFLETKGLKEGHTALIATVVGFEFLTIIYACMILRVKVAIIDPHMGSELYKAKLKQLNPDYGFIDSRLLFLQEHPILRWGYKILKKNAICLPYGQSYTAIATGRKLPLLQRHLRLADYKNYTSMRLDTPYLDHEFMIVYTSGTLSQPKGVVHTIESIFQSIHYIAALLQKSKARKLVTHLPHFMLIGNCAGVEVFLWEENWSASRKIDFIEKENIDLFFGPPADYLELIEYCNNQNRRLPDCLNHCLIGSAPVHRPFLKKLVNSLNPSCQITCLYGMTEHLITAHVDGRKKLKHKAKGDLLGRIPNDVSISIAPDGEILLKSPQLFKRYLHLHEIDNYHHTGDLGFINDDGDLELTGRKKDMIIRKNFNIYPALYESTIRNIPGVEEVVMIGIYNEDIADEIVILVIETKDQLEEAVIMKTLKSGRFKIDPEALPDRIVFEKIPRKGRQSKIDRKYLKQQFKTTSYENCC